MTLSGDLRTISYFKRFKMEAELAALPPVPALPAGYCWVAWHETLLDTHAEVLHSSFHGEIDATVFPSFGDASSCRTLMTEIARKSGFLGGATWLVATARGAVGSVQGVCERGGLGAIQNLGVLPEHRGRGLGEALLLQALHGFRNAGLGCALLEVTAQNDAAIRLYRRIGFLRRKTVYKAVDLAALVS
jgi:ribosomal protein S18 acetylase RimI-like enzyme